MAEKISLNLANVHYLAIHEFREVLSFVLGFTFKTSMVKGWRWESILKFTHIHAAKQEAQHAKSYTTQNNYQL